MSKSKCKVKGQFLPPPPLSFRSLKFLVFGLMALLGSVFLCVEPDVVYAAGTPCSITPVFTEANLNTCIAEAPTDNSEFTITIGADFNITAQKSIAAGKNVTLTSVNPASPATLTRGSSFTGRFFYINIASPSAVTLTIDSVILDGGSQATTTNNQLINNDGTDGVTINLIGNTVLRNNNSASSGGVIRMAGAGNNLNMAGNAQITNSTTLGGVVNLSGTFTMSGNAVISNNWSSGHAGGVNIGANGTFIMNGGIISNNVATSSGGGVYVNGAFIMYGGEISGNRADGTGGGGGVNSAGTTAIFTMIGGEINNNTAANGGGIQVATTSTLIMEGGTISSNIATNGGGGISVSAGATSTITGGEITNNTTTGNGGGISTSYGNLANLTVDASVVFSGNSASVATRMRPEDQALYDAQISATSFSLPLPFNGYNNYDISYISDLPTDLCQYNVSLWADAVNCVSAPDTGYFGPGAAGSALASATIGIGAVGVAIIILLTRKLFAKNSHRRRFP